MTYPKRLIKPSDIYSSKPEFSSLIGWKFVDFRPINNEDEAFLGLGNVVIEVRRAAEGLFNNPLEPRIILEKRQSEFEDIWE